MNSSQYEHFNPNELKQGKKGKGSKGGKHHLDEEVLYNKASILSDSGFGTFELCYSVLKACKGNEVAAKKELTNLIFK